MWAIFLSYLVSIDQASSEADRKLFGMLAYRMISKAAESVPSDSVCSSPFHPRPPLDVLSDMSLLRWLQWCNKMVIIENRRNC